MFVDSVLFPVTTVGSPADLPLRALQAYTTYKLGGQISELLYSPATYGVDLSAKDMIKPKARAAPMMAVLRNTLWLWGGTVEVGTCVHAVDWHGRRQV